MRSADSEVAVAAVEAEAAIVCASFGTLAAASKRHRSALAEQRLGKVTALALIDMCPTGTPRSLKAGSSGSCLPGSPGGCCGA